MSTQTNVLQETVNDSFAGHPAADYILGLFDPNDWVCVKLIRGKKGEPDHAILQWFTTAKDAASEKYLQKLERRNQDGFNVYVCMNPLSHGIEKRSKEKVTVIRNAYVEIDQDGDAALAKIKASTKVPKPSIILQSSPHKYHVIWQVEGFSPAEQELLNKTLVTEFGADPEATDCCRILRLPGFVNCKYPDKPVATILEESFSVFPYGRNAFKFDLSVSANGNGAYGDRTPFVAAARWHQGERNSGLLRTASSLRAKGLSDEAVRAAIFEENENKCDPPLDKAEVKALVKSALRQEYKNRDAERRRTPERVLRVDDFTRFVVEPIPPRPMILNPFLGERTLGMVHAWRGVGKTHIMLGMAVASASGGQFLKWKAPEPSPVVYVDGEMAEEDIQLWMREFSQLDGIPPIQPGFFSLIAADRQEFCLPSLSTLEGQHLIAEEVRKANAKSLYLDNISCLFRGGDEKEGTDWESAQEWLISLRRDGVSVILGHHDGKQGLQRGTSKREDPLNWVIQLKRPSDYQIEEGLRCEIHFEKARRLFGADARPFEAKLMTGEDGKPTWAISEMPEAQGIAAKRMHEEMGMSFSEIGKQLGISKGYAKKLYDKAVAAAQSRPEEVN